MKKFLLVLLIIFLIVQLFQPPQNNGAADSPTDIVHAVHVPGTVLTVLKESCYDCHSNHTDYPWYSRITPVNWWLNNHIHDGKKELNFSLFTSYPGKKMKKKLEEVAEMVEKSEMPLSSYTLIHSSAKLSGDERRLLIEWAKNAGNQLKD